MDGQFAIYDHPDFRASPVDAWRKYFLTAGEVEAEACVNKYKAQKKAMASLPRFKRIVRTIINFLIGEPDKVLGAREALSELKARRLTPAQKLERLIEETKRTW